MGGLCATGQTQRYFEGNNLADNLNQIKQASNQQLFKFLKSTIQIQKLTIQNRYLQNIILSIPKNINAQLRQKQQPIIKFIPQDFSKLTINNLQLLFKHLCNKIEQSKQIIRNNKIQLKEAQDGSKKLLEKVSMQKNILEKQMILTESMPSVKSVKSASLSKQDASSSSFNNQTKKYYDKMKEAIEKITKKNIFSQEENLEAADIQDVVLSRLNEIEKIAEDWKQYSKYQQASFNLQRQQDTAKMRQIYSFLQKQQETTRKLQYEKGELSAQLNTKTEKIKELQAQLHRKLVDIKVLQRKLKSSQSNTNFATNKDKQQSFGSTIKISENGSHLDSEGRSKSIVVNFANSQVLMLHENRISFYLRNCIEEMLQGNKKKILTSKKLFQYDPIRKNNLYKYIDDQNNLLFLGKLKNQVVIGSFSASPWKNPSDQNQAFIFSIAPHNKNDNKNGNKKYIKLVPQPNTNGKNTVNFTIDYLKFGVNEIRVTCETDECFSSFSSSNRIYHDPDNNHISLESFTCQKQTRYTLDTYEVYHLQLEQLKSSTQKTPKSAIEESK